MSQIHIGKINMVRSDKGTVQLYYHIPIAAPVAGVVPTSESSIAAMLQQAEIDALMAGALVEVCRDMVIFFNQSVQEITAAISADYKLTASEYNTRFNQEYKFWGAHFNANS